MQKNATVESMNVEIARFEGRKFYGKYSIDDYGPHHGLTYPEMKYDTSWDWIVPVCRKIEQLGYIVEVTFCLAGMCKIWNQKGLKGVGENNDPIMAVLQAVYQFITWYNDNQQKQNNDTTGTNKG